MRNLMILSVTMLAACGLSEDKFNEDFADKFCEELEKCGGECADTTGTATGESATCESLGGEYDSKAAKDCLDGAWSCEEIVTDVFIAIPPAVCGDVCGDISGGGDDTMTGTESR